MGYLTQRPVTAMKVILRHATTQDNPGHVQQRQGGVEDDHGSLKVNNKSILLCK